jgi:hypothetical protein
VTPPPYSSLSGGLPARQRLSPRSASCAWRGQLLLILLLAVAVYWLTEGLTSTAARISRVALLPYLVFYSAFDAVVGLSNGLVVKYRSSGRAELPKLDRHVLTVVTACCYLIPLFRMERHL